ncbi:hypothetical protein C8A00DRAFT_31572 [Chaetomidium leptoderma]|uniref:Transmembrane protein n=1 Tax=Chaetomidium leptoderma TaxID=669021 RepID=A0AAN6VPX9_9PEZI|nr:hypothetical protein C8A00DRAFT_31572 [Chaetomidium leptoderma]
MKPAQTLISLLTVAVTGVGVASGQFTTSQTAAAPALAPRERSNAATLVAREDMETVRQTRTRTVIRSSRTSTSTRPRPTSSKTKSDDDDDDDDTTTRRPTQTRSRTSTTTTTSIATTDSSTPTLSPSETSPPDGPKPGGGGGGGLSAGAAAGIAAAAVACVAIIAAIAFVFWRRRQGGIRGAVVTGEYPQGMAHMDSREPKLPLPPSPGPNGPGQRGQQGQGQGQQGQGQGQQYPEIGGGGDMGGRRSGSSGGGVSGETLFRIPPAGTMPGEPGFDAEYPPPPPQEQQQQHQWLGGNLGEASRPVSAFTISAYPSPGQPVLPVSPMTPPAYRPGSILSAQQPSQSRSRVSSYYPDTMMSPDMPAYLIPGGNRSRAMSFSSAPHVAGGPRVAELVGLPPPPAVHSFVAVVEEQWSPTRGRSHAGL